MTEISVDDIRQMAPDDLRRWIAEQLAPLLGCRVVATSEGMLGYPGIYYYHDDVINPSWIPVPDWPHDAGAALELVADIALKHEWHIGLYRNMPHVVGVYFWDGVNVVAPGLVRAHGDELDMSLLDFKVLYALALSRLAALALLEKEKEG